VEDAEEGRRWRTIEDDIYTTTSTAQWARAEDNQLIVSLEK
jgi:hypothetical protein